jgi:hypothetical protein
MPRHIFYLASMLQNFFSSPLTTMPNKLEGLSLETLSSQVLEFEGKARASPIGAPFRCFLLDKLLLLPANVRLHWKVIARYKHSSLFSLIISNEGKKFYNIDTCIDPYKDVISLLLVSLNKLISPSQQLPHSWC